ncbi:nuclear protein MDM1 isoform X2 [Hyperolius riggenbachi]|uniref:nuclear protein MDM1 isoform X2 n=1 Tax=Hyperolius riggenbachi TaxID=752182 RepID=UPI0035A27E53
MPVRFKASSEYDRNFKWRTSLDTNKEPSPMSRWAGLRSDELGITKEPSFPSKRRVPYYHPQISKSFQWKEDYVYPEEPVEIGHNAVKGSVEDKIITPDAPRLKIKARSRSAVPRLENKSRLSVAPRMHSADGRSEVPRLQLANGSSPVPKMKNNESDDKINEPPKRLSPQKESNGVHRVLQRKAGMNIAPSHHPSKMSEYRKQFEKKVPIESSPLIAAEQIIHNKNQSVPPFKLNNINVQTEYTSQYKGSPPSKGPKLRKDWEDRHITEYDQENHAPKRKDKKKKVEVNSGAVQIDKSSPEQKEVDHNKIIKEKFFKQLYTPTKFYRKTKTEYSANYLSPSDYKYKDGAWVREKHQKQAQVKELREKADYYRRRAQGTHFSRDHLNQILSRNNRFWDVSSTSSSEDVSNNIQALDLAGLQAPSRNGEKRQSATKVKSPSNTGNLGVSDVPTLPVRRKLAWDECEDTEETEKVSPLILEGDTPVEEEAEDNEDGDQAEENTEEEFLEPVKDNGPLRPEEAKLKSPEDESDCTSVAVVEGRLPTPKLKTLGLAQRTHHDRTTPATGGALLVSPPRSHPNSSEPKHKISEKKHISPNKTVFKGLPERNAKRDDHSAPSPPVAGLKTTDPLPLREDPWPNQIDSKLSPASISYPACRPTEKYYVPAFHQWAPSCKIRGSLRDPEFQHNGNFNSINYYNSPYDCEDSIEDDRLSQISARSAASSSLASQVLERAQKRKENFWGNK